MSDWPDRRFAATAAVALIVFADSSMPAPRFDGAPSHTIPMQIQGLPTDHLHVPDVEIQQAFREPVVEQITTTSLSSGSRGANSASATLSWKR